MIEFVEERVGPMTAGPVEEGPGSGLAVTGAWETEDGLVEHLDAGLEVGDAVLTGGTDPVSRIIQIGTRSPYSHIALVTGDGTLTEAYDYALTPDESDEGIYTLTTGELIERSKATNRLLVLRPVGVDRQRVVELAEYLRTHSPGFPSLGMVCLALCGISAPLLRLLPAGPRYRRTLRQIQLTADGTALMHCGEAATRIYHGAGLDLRFARPRLAHHITVLAERVAAAGLTEDLLAFPTEERLAVKGAWPSGKGPVKLGRLTAETVRSTRATWRQRAASDEPVDVADLIMPGDFARAEPFDHVGLFRRRGRRWTGFLRPEEQAARPGPGQVRDRREPSLPAIVSIGDRR